MPKPLLKAARYSLSDFTLRLGHPANEGNIWHKAALKLKQVAEDKSEAHINVLVYPPSRCSLRL